MRIGISLLTVELDRLGGLNLRLGVLIKGLAELGHEVIPIQTREALRESLKFYRSLNGLPVRPLEVNFHLGKSPLRWARLPALWCLPFNKIIPAEIDVLDLWDPLVNTIERVPCRVVFSHIYLNPYIWEHLRKCGLRSIALFPEIPFLERTIREEGRRVDGYVVEIERQRDWLVGRREIPEDSVAAIPPGFDAVLVQSARRSATKNTRPTIVFSGRLHKWKGVYELLEVFSLLAHDYPQWDLHFVGDGPARVGLHERVRDKGLQERVVFWGRRPHDQAVRIVAGAEVFVLPSYIEVFPISLLEAMALGVPAIATDVGGVKDYMIEDGVTGLLIPPKDPKALRRALARLASSPELRRSLGENGQELVKNLTFDKMVGSTTEFYAHVLSQD